jgi:hypothetical protein
LRRPAVAAVAAGLLFTAFALTSGRLPSFSFHADLVVSMTIGMGLVAVVVFALVPLRHDARSLGLLAAGGLAVAVIGHLAGVVVVSDAGKVAFGTAVGFYLGARLAELTRDVRWVVWVALIVAAVDAFSVFSSVGVTNLILTKAPESVPYFVVAFPAFGYSLQAGEYSALGTADVIFFGLYLVSAAAFGLRTRATAAAMVVSVALSVAVASWWRAVPALPLLGLAFVVVNADLLWRTPRPRYVDGAGDGEDVPAAPA